MIHRVQFRGRAWEPANLQAESLGQILAIIGGMRCTTVFKQDDAPTAPMGANHPQKVLMRGFIPDFSDQYQ